MGQNFIPVVVGRDLSQGSDGYGQGRRSLFIKGVVHGTVPQYFRSDVKGVDLTGLLGDIKKTVGLWDGSLPAGSRVGAPIGSLGDKVLHKLKLFCETTLDICIKIQQTTTAVTRVDILNDITSKILGGHYHGCPPFINRD